MNKKSFLVIVILLYIGIVSEAALPTFPTSSSSTSSSSSSSTSSSTITTAFEIPKLKIFNRTSNISVRNVTHLRNITFVTPTVKKYICGNDPTICNVEFDSTGDGVNECCTESNNPECRSCLAYCKNICSPRGEGVLSCFGNKSTGIGCDCSGKAPTCYSLTTTTVKRITTTTIKTIVQGSKINLFYLGIIVLALLASIGIVLYISRI